MAKKYKKAAIITIIFILILNVFINISNASNHINKLLNITNNYENSEDNTGASEKVENLMRTLLIIAKVIGIAVAIVILLTIAMKYMIASPGDRADIKKSAVIYVVGAFILFGVVGILQVIEKFAEQIK